MTLELLVTGSGRSGTGFFATTLTAVGVPCTHEGLFGPYGPIPGHEAAAESSWMAVPYLPVNAPVVVVVRDPVAVVRSLLGVKFFEAEGPYRDFALKHEPDLASLSPRDAAWSWWTRWYQRALPHAEAVLVLESLEWPVLEELIGVPAEDLSRTAASIGHYNARDRCPIEDVMDADGKLVVAAQDLYRKLAN